MSHHDDSGISVLVEKIPVGACVDCNKERRGFRCNPPITFDAKNKQVLVECMAQEGKQMPTRTDIKDCTECEFYDIDLAEVRLL